MMLYVVGQDSANPAEWDETWNYALILATSPAMAVQMALAADPSILERVHEIAVDKPLVLATFEDRQYWVNNRG